VRKSAKAKTDKRRKRDAAYRRQARERRAAVRYSVPNDQHQLNPLTLFRNGRLAVLFDCDRSTIWRMRKSGKLPPPAFTDPFEAWTFAQIEGLLTRRSGG
jgi:hypothetical protein